MIALTISAQYYALRPCNISQTNPERSSSSVMLVRRVASSDVIAPHSVVPVSCRFVSFVCFVVSVLKEGTTKHTKHTKKEPTRYRRWY
jgi:hypothetical protein